jgi:hypothetical protein
MSPAGPEAASCPPYCDAFQISYHKADHRQPRWSKDRRKSDCPAGSGATGSSPAEP